MTKTGEIRQPAIRGRQCREPMGGIVAAEGITPRQHPGTIAALIGTALRLIRQAGIHSVR